MNKEEKVMVKAVLSGKDTTSGKIIVIKNGISKEIPAVIFDQSKVDKLFNMIKK